MISILQYTLKSANSLETPYLQTDEPEYKHDAFYQVSYGHDKHKQFFKIMNDEEVVMTITCYPQNNVESLRYWKNAALSYITTYDIDILVKIIDKELPKYERGMPYRDNIIIK